MQVLWTEGIYLSPQHFQLWEREVKAESWLRQRTLTTQPTGILSLDLICTDGQLSLRAFQGVLPDGSPVSLPGRHAAPAQRQLPSSPDSLRRGIWLALPEEHSGLANLAGPGVLHPARYHASKVRVPDVYGEADVAEIDVGISQFRLLYDGEPLDGFIALKIGELVREASGVWALNTNFIPSCLRCDASTALMSMLRDLAERFAALLAALQPRRELALSTEGFGDGLKVMWVSMVLSQGLSRLRHAIQLGSMPIEAIHADLCSLASQLAVFHAAPLPIELPPFRVEQAWSSFRDIVSIIVSLLNISFPTGFQRIEMTRRDEHTRTCKLDATGDLEAQQVYLFVRGLAATGATLKDLVGTVRVSAEDQIDHLAVHSLPGIELQPTEPGQARLPDQADGYYLKLRAAGIRWERFVETRSLAAWLPDRFASVESTIYLVT